MKKEKFYEILGDLDENIIKAAETPPARKAKFAWIGYGTAIAACIALIIGIGTLVKYPDDNISTDTTIQPITTETSPTVSVNTFTTPPEETSVTVAVPSETTVETSETPSVTVSETVTAIPTATETTAKTTNSETTATETTSSETVPPAESTTISEPPAETTRITTYLPLSPENYISNENTQVLASAKYPEMPQYSEEDGEEHNAWLTAVRELRDQSEIYADCFDDFFINSAKTFLSGSKNGNKIYSPVSLYVALGMCAEITEGNTRQQILDALSQNDMDFLRKYVKAVWLSNYSDDGLAECIFADSLWTNSELAYEQSTVDSLAENYFASVFSGDPRSYEYNKMFQDWVSEQTKGMFIPASDSVMSPEMVFTLASTVYYSGKWENKFRESETRPAVFHSPNGDTECDFMNQTAVDEYYWGDKFAAIAMRLEYNGEMRIILPDEGVAPEELFSDEQAVKFMLADRPSLYQNRKYTEINISVPKFDVSSDIDLEDGLRQMGITDIFESSKSDFTPLTGDTDIIEFDAKQNTRVLIDENGCKASALTGMSAAGAGEPDEEVDFIADRPFIFEIVSDTGFPLFVGIVNNPLS